MSNLKNLEVRTRTVLEHVEEFVCDDLGGSMVDVVRTTGGKSRWFRPTAGRFMGCEPTVNAGFLRANDGYAS